MRRSGGRRAVVETLFKRELVQVVCTTSTLALGVNLPVYLVVIKGTVQWRGGAGATRRSATPMLQQMGGVGGGDDA